MVRRVITLSQVNKMAENGISTFSVKDTGIRGCKTVPASQISVGDEIVLNNYFTEVIANEEQG